MFSDTERQGLTHFVAGLSAGCGRDSPVNKLDTYIVARIGEYVKDIYFHERMLDMLADYSDAYFQHNVEDMHQVYCEGDVSKMVPSVRMRYQAYLANEDKEFLDRPAVNIHCKNCGVYYYDYGCPEDTPLCVKCHQDSTYLIDIHIGDIPPWVEVETFAGYVDDDSIGYDEPDLQDQYQAEHHDDIEIEDDPEVLY